MSAKRKDLFAERCLRAVIRPDTMLFHVMRRIFQNRRTGIEMGISVRRKNLCPAERIPPGRNGYFRSGKMSSFTKTLGENSDTRHAGFAGRLGDGLGDGCGDAAVERGRDDIIRRELVVRDESGDGLGCGDLHRVVDVAGADV